MKVVSARKLAAALTEAADRNRLNENNHNPTTSQVDLIQIVSQIDDEARAKLQEAIDAAKANKVENPPDSPAISHEQLAAQNPAANPAG